jgi:hypothetical protein
LNVTEHNDTLHNALSAVFLIVKLRVITRCLYNKCHCVLCHYAEGRYAEGHNVECMVRVVMLTVIMLSMVVRFNDSKLVWYLKSWWALTKRYKKILLNFLQIS